MRYIAILFLTLLTGAACDCGGRACLYDCDMACTNGFYCDPNYDDCNPSQLECWDYCLNTCSYNIPPYTEPEDAGSRERPNS